MAKALKIAGAVVAVAGLALVTGGLAAGASLSFIMSAGSGLAGLTVGGLFTASALLNTAGSLLSPKPKAPSTSASNADRLTVSMDLRAFRKIVIGTTAMATDLRDQEWSADQSLLHRFIVSASHRSGAVREIWFDDKLAWTLAGGVQGEYRGYLTVVPVLEGSAANAINIGPRMGGARRFTGLTYVYLRYKLTGNSKKTESPFASSIPSRVTIVGDGALFYDPRLDSTVPGGAGPMRADDQRTWAWNASACRNPALALLFYLLGWRIQNPVTGEWKLAVGKGIPASRIDLPSFITAANICDEPVTTAAGVSEPRYRADGIFSEGDDPGLVLDNLKAAMNAVLDDADGKIRVTVLHNDLATPIGDLTANDVLGEFTWLQTPPLTDSINVIRGGYIDPSRTSLFQLVDFPEVAIASPDGIDRPQTVNLALVQSPSQAQRLVKMRLARAQYGGTYTAIFQATAWKYQKGDVIRFSFHPLGWDKKLFRIADVATQVDGTVPMMLREEHPAIYAAYSDERAAVQPAAPTSYDPGLWPVLQGIVDAGTTAEWPGITGPGKPADNATNSADPDSPFGPDGTVKEALATLERVTPIERDTSALKDAKVEHDKALALLEGARVDMEAVQRQAERDAGRIDETLLRLLAESSRTRDVLRDAGIVVDPVTGVVRIYAIDQLADRTSKAEVTLDGQKALITSKASVDYVDEKIALAVLDPSQAAKLEPIIARLTSAEQEINGAKAAIALKAEALELTRVSGRVTTVSQTVDALAGTVVTKADSTTVDALGATVTSIRQDLDAMGDTVGFSVAVRQARAVAEDAATAGLRAMLAGDAANRRQITQAAEARQEVFTRIDTGLLTEAGARLALAVEVGAVRAMTVAETTARVTADEIAARNIAALGVTSGQQSAAIGELREASLTAAGGIAGVQMTIRQAAGRADTSDEAMLRALIAGDQASRDRQAQLVQVQTQFTTSLVANEAASAIARQTLLARMGSAEAAIADTNRVLADRTQALTQRIAAAEAVFSDAETGLAATRARLIREETLRAQGDKVNADALTLLDAVVNDPATGLPWARGAVADLARVTLGRDDALSESIRQVRAVLDGIGDVGIQQAFEAVVTRLGKVEGRYTVTIDANGNLTGFQLIGSDAGPGTLNLINTDLRMGTGRIIWNNGQFMEVKGIGFGQNRDLLSWYGPTMAIDACSRANGLEWKGTDGLIYTAAAIKAGPYVNSGTSTLIAADASFTLGPFTSNGKSKAVVASYTYRRSRRVAPGGGGSATGAPSATLALEYQSGPGIWSQVATIQTGNPLVTVIPATGEDPGVLEEAMSGSVTWTDTRTMLDGYLYRLRLTARQQASFSGDAQVADSITQSLSILSQE